MALLALLFSIFVAAIGAIGFVSPAKLFHIVWRFQSSAGLYVAAGFRVVLGSALFFAADRSRALKLSALSASSSSCRDSSLPYSGLIVSAESSIGGPRVRLPSNESRQDSPSHSVCYAPTPWHPAFHSDPREGADEIDFTVATKSHQQFMP